MAKSPVSWLREAWQGRARSARRLEVEALEGRLVPSAASLLFDPAAYHPLVMATGPGQVETLAASGDFNKDGLADAVTVNHTTNNLIVYPGNGDGTFGTGTILHFQDAHAGTAGQVAAVALGDFNHDGKLDVAAAGTDGTLDVFLNNGAGGFQALAPVAVGTTDPIVSLAAGNFTGDGNLDLALLSLTGKVGIVTGNGDGTFNAAGATFAPVAGSNGTPEALVAGNFNRDAKSDLAVLSQNGSANSVEVLLNAGAGTFVPGQTLALPGGPASLAVGDLNGDGYSDLVVDSAGTLDVFRGIGNGAFQPGQQVGQAPAGESLVQVGDVDGDGRPDLLTGGTPGGGLGVLLNASVVPTQLQVTGPTQVTAGQPFSITVTAQTASGQTDGGFADPVYLTGAPNLPGSYTFTPGDHGSHTFQVTLNNTGPEKITATDFANRTVTGSLSLSVAVPSAPQPVTAPLSLSGPNTLPPDTAGHPYSQTLTATGGTGALTFGTPVGSPLPPGLSLNPKTGALSGTPTQAGVFSFLVSVTDQAGATVTGRYYLTVNPPLQFTSPATLPADTVGVAYSQKLTTLGGTAPELFTLSKGSTLPAGLSLDPKTGTLSGTPSQAGSVSFGVVASDASGATATQTETLAINPASSAPVYSADQGVVTAVALPGGQSGSAYQQTVPNVGIVPQVYLLGKGSSLPPGLSLDPKTGAVSGTPTHPGTYQFQVTEQSGTGAVSSQKDTLTIAPANGGTFALPGGMVGEAYSQPTAAGGSSGHTYWLAAKSSLPPGLNLNAGTGVISGTPELAGNFSFTVVVTDSTGAATGLVSYTLGVSKA